MCASACFSDGKVLVDNSEMTILILILIVLMSEKNVTLPEKGDQQVGACWYSICARHDESDRTTRIAINFGLAATEMS